MGFGNKRKRSKRKKTRNLCAMNHRISHENSSESSFEEASDRKHSDMSHSSNFWSTHSHYGDQMNESAAEDLVPNSIFMDDVSLEDETPAIDDLESEVSDHGIEDGFILDDIEKSLDVFNATNLEVADNTDNDISSSSSSSSDSCGTTNDPWQGLRSSNDLHHRFDQVTPEETASFKIMSLLDSSGAPRNCYDRLVALLKKLSKNNGFDIMKAVKRETLMRRLQRKFRARPRIEGSVINQQEVLKFSFVDMLQDLLLTCTTKHLHQITPRGLHDSNIQDGQEHELWNTPWMKETLEMVQYRDFDPKKQVMLPIILYMDKTGTDVNQHYGLEPVLFSSAAIAREYRESRHFWRHLGFVPHKKKNEEESSHSGLQCYHDCLAYLLAGLKEAQENPPTIALRTEDGSIVHRKALLPLMLVMGDQLSQDTLCGRMKSNAGGAGRVHRSCMCSYANIDNPYHKCSPVDQALLQMLTKQASLTDDQIADILKSNEEMSLAATSKSFLMRQRKMYRSILRHPYTMHPIQNAFEGMNFGSWSAGIHDASFDDFMHSVEAGTMSYIAETVYNGLTKKEKERVEEITQPMLDNERCSVVSNYPRWRLQPGFTRQTLLTSGERVGSVFALCLSLHEPTIRQTICSAHRRQVEKYIDLTTVNQDSKKGKSDNKSTVPTPPPVFYLDLHMHNLDKEQSDHTLEQMIRHGFDTSLMDGLDTYQVNQMIWHCSAVFEKVHYPQHYPSTNIGGYYRDLGNNFQIPRYFLEKVWTCMSVKPSKVIERRRSYRVEGSVRKHLKKKCHRKGDGATAAVLTKKMGTLIVYLEFNLFYHAFCKYSWSLPVFLQRHYDNIRKGNQFIVEYFQKLMYRGNATIDSRFPKIHSQCRMGENHIALNTVMNSTCETGERLLKTEAKGVSKTAQKRGMDTFLRQTMERIQDRFVLDGFAKHLDVCNEANELQQLDVPPIDHFGRNAPHFLYDALKDKTWALDRKYKRKKPNVKTGSLSTVVTTALKELESHTKTFEIYNEVVLRDKSRVRASPNYNRTGPWYDYANITWEQEGNSGTIDAYQLPAKCLCFFRIPDKEEQTTHREDSIMALIHTVDEDSVGKVTGRTDSLLTRHFNMQFDKKGNPKMYIVPVASIDSAIRCFSHASSKSLFNPEAPGITYVLPRNQWAYMWMAFNDILEKYNTDDEMENRKHKLASLDKKLFLEAIRDRCDNLMKAKNEEDL